MLRRYAVRNDGCVLATSGMQADAATLRKVLRYKATMYKHDHHKVIFLLIPVRGWSRRSDLVCLTPGHLCPCRIATSFQHPVPQTFLSLLYLQFVLRRRCQG